MDGGQDGTLDPAIQVGEPRVQAGPEGDAVAGDGASGIDPSSLRASPSRKMVDSRVAAIHRALPYQEDKYKACRSDQVMPEGDDFDHTINEFASPLSDRLPRGHARRQERRTASTDRAARARGR
jgi:hypothetical protein